MRLLQRSPKGIYRLQTFHGTNIPPYAILSHTWGSDNDEVSFKDLENATAYKRPGYKKLQFCAQQANKDGLLYFWIDTCCINKSSDQELSEAINSMFRWYQTAAKCYVYLSDISDISDMSIVTQSRWFTRGWTLQELLAPRNVQFYDRNGMRLGNKEEIGAWIQWATGIPLTALNGCSLDNFSVEERLSWAKYRTTTRVEDGAYSLLGVFDVSMPLIYGEGRDRAYNRLFREIESSGRTRSVDPRYAGYLPSEEPRDLGKALGTAADGSASAAASSSGSHLTIGQGTGQTWDANSQRWTQIQWSSQYQRHYRNQYTEGM
jgi:hypothetical protein